MHLIYYIYNIYRQRNDRTSAHVYSETHAPIQKHSAADVSRALHL